MTDLPKIVRERMRTTVAGDHPDPDVLTAFAEQALPERERRPLLNHLARCADCRDVLALASVPGGSAATQGKDTIHARFAPWFTFPMLRWGALAACLVIVSTAVLLRQDLKTTYVTKDERQEAVPRLPAVASVDSVHADNAAANRPTETKTKPLADVQVPAAASSYVAAAPRASREKPLTASIPAPRQTVAGSLAQPAAPAASGASPVLAKDLRDDRQIDGARGAFAFGVGNGSAPTLPAPAPVPPAPTNKNVPAPHLAANAQNYTQTNEPLTQMVDAVNADSDKSEKKVEIPGRAKTAAAPASAALAVAPSDELELQKSIAPAAAEAAKARKGVARSAWSEGLRWNISSDGQLQRSSDSGKSWQPVTVAEGATFRALTFNGPDIWVGGAAGSLYHSPDAGGHWTQVKPVANAVSLTADIAAIAFTDPQHGKITTTNGQTWSTSDGGQSWMQQP
jgi:Photosynthesis system II assembly factor YCF48